MRQKDASETEGEGTYKTVIRPAMLYGADTWATTKETRKKD